MKYKIATMLTLLLLTGCVDAYQARKTQLEAFHDTIQSGLERDGVPKEQAARMALAETWQYAQQLQQQDQQARQTQALERIANGASQLPYNPYSVSGGVQPVNQPSGLGIRSWHNSDGSSGQYVPYPGGNGGTIFNSDGTVTNVDPAIGR